jgi:hypothetical protein
MTDPNETELADIQRNEAIVGRNLRRSLIVFVAVGLVVVVVVVWLRNRQPEVETEVMTPVAPELREPPAAEIPAVTFTDVTAESGIDFVHVNGAYGEKLLPETMGGGCAFFDFDNDHDQDLLFVSSGMWPWQEDPADGERPPKVVLYRNDSSGRFDNVTADCGLDLAGYGMGVAVADYDGDGFVDVFLSAVGRNQLYRNLGGGRFEDITDTAGVAGEDDRWSSSCGFFDYDNDGDLDLFVCNYVKWSREVDLAQAFVLTGVGRAYGPPKYFEGTFPYLYRNEGEGRFSDVSAEAGIQVTNPATGVPMGKSLGVRFVDLDRDGWLDIVVSNDTVQNFVFRNEQDGMFREIGTRSGIAFDSEGNARGAMGIDAAYYRNGRDLGIAVGNFATEMTALYVSLGKDLLFTDEAIAAGLGPPTRLELTFGLFFFDYDLDGRLDLLSANGHVEDEINKVQESQEYRQPAHLFWNAGQDQTCEFLEVPAARCGEDLGTPVVGRGSSYADIDGDGDLDVVLTQISGSPLLLRNNLDRMSHYLRLQLVGKPPNRDAIGSWVEVRRGDQTMRRQVMPARSYLSQVELPVTVGLGDDDGVERVIVHWPDGTSQDVRDYRLDNLTVVEKSD